jgi:hypothetical protein
MKIFTTFSLSAVIILASSCQMVRSVGVNATSGILKESSAEVNTEANYEFFKKSAAANLKIVEGLWFSQKENESLLTLLIKGYAGVAFGINETEYLHDQLSDNEIEVNKKQALYNYSKSFRYGLEFLKLNDISEDEVFNKEAPIKIRKKLTSELSSDDREAVFYFAQAWGGMINLQRDDVAMMANLGTVKALMDWVCDQDYEFENGSCYLFDAVYEAGRPRMLGGSLKKGNEIFQKVMKKYPEHLLAKITYLQFFVIPTMNEVEFAKVVEGMTLDKSAFEGVKNYSQMNQETERFLNHPELNLYNAIALKRLEIILKNRQDLF